MKTNYKTPRGFTLVELLVVIVIIAALAGLTAPMVIRQRKKADQTEATNNAHQIGLALMEFDTEYGSYPDLSTGTAVTTATGAAIKAGTDANARFQQLFAAGMTQSEAMFFAKSAYTKKPDGIITDDTKTLDEGENGFGIIMSTGTVAHSSAGNPGRPIAAAPFEATPAADAFDKDPYDGKAVILKMDNSVVSLPIRADKNVFLNGLALTSTAPDALYEGKTTAWALPMKKP